MPSTQVSNKSKWYPAEDITAPVKSARVKRNSSRIAKLRKTITPGSVLILLSGRFRGNRVVFLKQLSSGALLVTGKLKNAKMQANVKLDDVKLLGTPLRLPLSLPMTSNQIMRTESFNASCIVYIYSETNALCLGPYQVNGVPLRRVNQAYVIATSAKVDISGVALPEIDDSYFAREKSSNKKDEEQFFAQSSTVSVY